MKSRHSFLKSGHLPTLVSSFLYFDMSFMVWVLLGALGNYIAADFGLNASQKGLMTAIPLLGGSILRLVLGYLTDSIGARKTGLIGLSLTFIPLLAGWLLADSIAKIYLVGLLLGVAGASFAVSLPMVSRWYPPEHQGLAMGIAGAGNSGTIFATLFAPRLAEVFGWHAVFAIMLIPIAIVMIVFAIFAKDSPKVIKKPSLSEYLAVFKEEDTRLFAFFYSVTFGGFVGLASFLSILLRDQYGISKVHAGDLTSLCVFAGSFMRPLGGFLADKLGGIRTLLFLYAAVGMLMLGLAQLPSLGMGIILFFLVMGCLGMGNGSVFQLVPQRFGERVGVVTGILGAAGGIGGFFLSIFLGWLNQFTGSYATGLFLFAIFAFIALILLAFAKRRWIGLWLDEGGRILVRGPVFVRNEPEISS